MPTTIFAVGLLECRYRGSRIWTLPCLVGAPHHLRIPLPDCQYPYPEIIHGAPSAGVEPAHTRGRKEEDPKICDRCDLPLIPTKAWTGGLSITASRKRGIGLPATVGVCHSDAERAERVRYAVRTGQCYATQGVRRIQGGYEKRVQTKSPRFEPSNPLTIMPCTSRNVKSSRVGKAACARRRDGRAAVPSRSCRLVGSCHDCATSRSCSRRIGTRIRAGVRRIPLP